jgi:hypothetical protein
MMRAMTQVLFLPQYAQVLEQVLVTAEADGELDLSCRSDVDPAVVAAQVTWYARSTGRTVKCTPRAGRVEVRATARAGRQPARTG